MSKTEITPDEIYHLAQQLKRIKKTSDWQVRHELKFEDCVFIEVLCKEDKLDIIDGYVRRDTAKERLNNEQLSFYTQKLKNIYYAK